MVYYFHFLSNIAYYIQSVPRYGSRAEIQEIYILYYLSSDDFIRSFRVITEENLTEI